MAESRHFLDLLYETRKNNVNTTPVFGPHERHFISQWNQSGIHSDVLTAFASMKIAEMKPLQQNGISFLMKNYNTVLIDFAKTKSVSYLASILTLLINNSDNKFNTAKGIQAIILGSSKKSCDQLEILTKRLISKSQYTINVVVSYAAISEDITMEDLYNGNGCTVLITTPISLFHLLDIMKNFNWSNLRHFVFDSLDILLKDYKDHMIFFSNILMKLKDQNPVQIITTSDKWDEELDNYLNLLLVNWQYVFGAHIEAARFMKTQFNVVKVKKEDKLDLMLDIIMNHSIRRWILFTSNTDQSLVISKYIMAYYPYMETLVPGQMNSDIRNALNKWNTPLENKQRIWICSDIRLYDFYIDNSDCIIHFNVPLQKEIFSIRYSVLQDSSTTLVTKDRKAYILLDDNKDNLEFTKFMKIIRELGHDEIMPNLLDSIEKIPNQTVINKTECNKPLTIKTTPKEKTAEPGVTAKNIERFTITDVTEEIKLDPMDNQASLGIQDIGASFGELEIEDDEIPIHKMNEESKNDDNIFYIGESYYDEID